MEASSALVNLALLESLKGNKVADEIDLFVPYLALAICALDEDSFGIVEIKESFNELFSISPPEAALKVILTRAKKNDLVRLSNHQYFKVPEKLNSILEGTREKRREIEVSLSILIGEFLNYSQENHGIEISEQEASSFLYEFIKNHVSEFAKALAGDFSLTVTKIKNKEYLTASFIKFLYEVKKERLSDLDRIIKGVLLANYITYADKITAKNRFKNISIYLDSPIILGLFGYSGPIRKRSLNEFLSLLHELEVTVCVFDATVDEVQRLFSAWKDGLEKKSYDKFNPKTLELLKSKGLGPSGLETEIALTESKIKKHDINIREYFKIDKKYQCDEVALEQHLKSWGFNNDLRHDVTCMSRIFNTRKGISVNSFDSEFSIFATLNSKLEKSINDHFEVGAIPLIASERWLATMLWTKSPNVFSELPLNLLLSNAYSTVYSDDRFWASFLTRLDDLKKRGSISEGDFVLVRWDKSLMEKVHNASIEAGEDFENEDIFDIVDNIKKEHVQEKDDEIASIKKENENRLEILRKEKQDVEVINSQTDAKIRKLAHGAATVISVIVTLGLIIAVIYGLLLSVPNNPLVKEGIWDLKSWGAALSISILLILTLGNLFLGTTVKGLYFRAHGNVKSAIIRYFE